jgi:uncharacterized protein YjbJ (UPF0337 family)
MHPNVSGEFIMNAFPWVIAGVGAGLAAYFILNQPDPQFATGYDEIEDAAGKTAFWGSKQRVRGAGGSLVGKLKEGVGRATGDDQLETEGVVDQVAGTVQDVAGQAAHAVADTIHELNR